MRSAPNPSPALLEDAFFFVFVSFSPFRSEMTGCSSLILLAATPACLAFKCDGRSCFAACNLPRGSPSSEQSRTFAATSLLFSPNRRSTACDHCGGEIFLQQLDGGCGEGYTSVAARAEKYRPWKEAQ